MKHKSKSAEIFTHRFFKTAQQIVFTVGTLLMSNLVLAQASGGLSKGTDAANDWKVWGYTFLGVIVFVFLIWNVIMALIDKKTWNDVLMALGEVAAAGGVLSAGVWAWGIWGS